MRPDRLVVMKMVPLAIGCVAIYTLAACSTSPTSDGASSGNPSSDAAGRAPSTARVSYFSDPAKGCRHSQGRAGQARVMVPDDAFSLTICSQRAGLRSGPVSTKTVTAAFADIEILLNAGTRQPARYRCDAGGLARTYTLVFAYRVGPSVAVDVTPDCQPSITNGSIRTNNTSDVVTAVDQLIGLH